MFKLLTPKSTNLGYGWSHTPEPGTTKINDPVETVTGTIYKIRAARRHAQSVNSGGTWWREDFFIDGLRVIGDDKQNLTYLVEGTMTWGYSPELGFDVERSSLHTLKARSN